MLFTYQAPIFGAIILYKILALRKCSCQNLSVYACVLTVAIFIVVQRYGTQEAKERLPRVNIDNHDFFKDMYPGFTNVSCTPQGADAMVRILFDQIVGMSESMNVSQFNRVKEVLEFVASPQQALNNHAMRLCAALGL